MSFSRCSERRNTLKNKSLLIVSIIFLSLLLCSSQGFSATLQWGHVSSVKSYYDDPTLTGGDQEQYYMWASVSIDENINVYLDGGPLSNYQLEYYGTIWGDHEYGDSILSPVPGPVWEDEYTFWADIEGNGIKNETDPTFTWSISAGQIKEMELPENVIINGNQLTWDSVEYANQYRVRAYTLDNGFIYYYNLFYNGVISDPTGETIIFDLTEMATSMMSLGLGLEDIAIVIISREYIANGWANSSSYYFRPIDHFSSVFADVPPGYWAEEFINKIYENGITSGCSKDPLMYCPEDTVTRAQMAVFLERGINDSDYSPPGATGVFDDCPVSHWAADWVEQFYADGITSGCSTNPMMYCPDDLVTRAQMAVFLLRSMYGNGYTPPSAAGIFDDVPVTHWAADWIEALHDEGITGGCSTNPPLYCPDDVVNRAQMAVFIVRAFDL